MGILSQKIYGHPFKKKKKDYKNLVWTLIVATLFINYNCKNTPTFPIYISLSNTIIQLNIS